MSLPVFSSAGLILGQPTPPPKVEKEPATIAGFSPTNEAELAFIQDELFKLLRMSPNLTSAVACDPSLVGYQEYMSSNNPELAD
jgi:hypothetical protein